MPIAAENSLKFGYDGPRTVSIRGDLFRCSAGALDVAQKRVSELESNANPPEPPGPDCYLILAAEGEHR